MNIFKRLKTLKLIADQKGQGAIEYILILTVTVAIIVGVMSQFNQSFRDYAESYFGAYLTCLLENGELPSLGIEGGGVNANACEGQFQPFTLAEGRPPNESNSQNNSGDNNNETSDGRGVTNSPDRFSSNSSGGGGSGGSGRGGRAGSGGGSGGSPRSFASNATSTKKPKDKIVVGGDGSATIGKLNNGKRDDHSNAGDKGKKRVGRFNAYGSGKDKNENGKVKVRGAKQSEDSSKKSKSFRQEASVKKNQGPEIEADWSFGDYLRYLIIAAILIILLFVVGGQIFQAQKGSE